LFRLEIGRSNHQKRQGTLTAPEPIAWNGQSGSLCMQMNTRSRRHIDYASWVDCSSVFFQERGQAENKENKDGGRLILACLDVTRDARESI